MSEIVDVLGVGFGPANVALAIALEEMDPDITARFLEASADPQWQSGMLLDRSDIQNHPSRDLVTLRNPRSRYSFLNYLHEAGRLVEHLNLPGPYPLRKEYAQYISWATNQFRHLTVFGDPVIGIEVESSGADRWYVARTRSGAEHRGRIVVLAPGRTPFVPEPFDGVNSPRVFHFTHYLSQIEALTDGGAPRRVAVIGGSQSAVELTLDLSARFKDTNVVTYLRAPSLRLKDTSPFSDEVFFPQFTEYFFRSSPGSRKLLNQHYNHTNYSSVDADILHELYRLIYEQQLDGEAKIQIRGNRAIEMVEVAGDSISLTLREVHTGLIETDAVDFVVLATGFKNLGTGVGQEPWPPLLTGLSDRFRLGEDGAMAITDRYGTVFADAGHPPLFLNGLCESSHGMGDAGSFSLLSVRAETILSAIRDYLHTSHLTGVS